MSNDPTEQSKKLSDVLRAKAHLYVQGSSETQGRSEQHDALHTISTATPCGITWDSMSGDEYKRTCQTCGFYVFGPAVVSPEMLHQMSPDKNGHKLGSLLYRRADGTYMAQDCFQRRYYPSWPWALAIVIIPWSITAATYLAAPGYMTPYLYHPIARMLLLAVAGWNLIGVYLFSRTRNQLLQGIVFVVFAVPLIVLPMLGPSHTSLPQASSSVHWRK